MVMKKLFFAALSLIGCQQAQKEQPNLSPEDVRDMDVKKVTDSLRQLPDNNMFDRMFAHEGAEVWLDGSWGPNGPYRLPWGMRFTNCYWQRIPFDSTHAEWKRYAPYYEALKRYEESTSTASRQPAQQSKE
jgi:hypothetical protein